MKGEIVSEDWNTPYVLKFHKSRRVGDIQHRNSTWLILRKHSEIDSSSPPLGHTTDCIPLGRKRSHLEFFRFNISALSSQKGSNPPALHLRHCVVHWSEFSFVPITLWQINCKQSKTCFCLTSHQKTSGEKKFFVTDSFYAVGSFRNDLLFQYMFFFRLTFQSHWNSIQHPLSPLLFS